MVNLVTRHVRPSAVALPPQWTSQSPDDYGHARLRPAADGHFDPLVSTAAADTGTFLITEGGDDDRERRQAKAPSLRPARGERPGGQRFQSFRQRAMYSDSCLSRL